MLEIDLRSDTVTRPDVPMLNAMMKAQTGDDVFGEDPTVNLLQERLADAFGQEAGLFCPSGTMTNQIAINVHTRPGDEVICDRLAHIYNYEGGGIARNSGASVRLVSGNRGRFTKAQAEDEINPGDSYYARTSMISIEDTCNKGGGACYELSNIAELSQFAHSKSLAFHLDGARAYNAIVAKGHDTRNYGSYFDSISICLSKGLGAPAGSVLLGSREFIREAHRTRKVLGGGMRQAGILAAAGIYALDHRVKTLADDHRRAKRLGDMLEASDWISAVEAVETNIVIAEVNPPYTAAILVEALSRVGIHAIAFGKQKVRFVTHFDFTETHLKAFSERLPRIQPAG